MPFPIIVIAEIFSWYACTTSNYIGTVVEESLWAVAASITVYGFYLALPYYKDAQRKFLMGGIIVGIAYIFYMLLVDVPAYVNGWISAEAAGKSYLTIINGFKEICTQWHLTYAYEDWKYEMVWMSLYFSVAVWGSLFIINAPFLNDLKKENLQVPISK